MPVYEYVCPSCEVRFEKLRPMTDGRLTDCPTCGVASARVLSMFAAFSKGAEDEMAPVGGGGCPCAAGGACGCAAAF